MLLTSILEFTSTGEVVAGAALISRSVRTLEDISNQGMIEYIFRVQAWVRVLDVV
jgi:hypothetical protein